MKEYSIDVNLSEEDISDLDRGKKFNWSLPTNEDGKVFIKINLFKEEWMENEKY